MSDPRVYLGTSIKLPIQLQLGRGVIADGLKSVEQSIVSILTTPKGSRFFLPEYGSRIEQLLFDPNDEVLRNLLPTLCEEALSEWEKRIAFVDAVVERGEDKINIMIKYKILPSNEINSFVFPYYAKLVY